MTSAFDRRSLLQRGSVPAPRLHERLSAAARKAVGDDYEIVLVNDGSRDGSWPIMQQLAAEDPHVVAVNLSRNHGHQLALTAGLDLCRGDTILIIDADLQDPPELLARRCSRRCGEQEADVVYGVRKSRRGRDRVQARDRARFLPAAVARDRGRHSARRRRLPADEPPRARRACWRCPSRRASSAAWSRGSASGRCRSPTTGRSASPARPNIR